MKISILSMPIKNQLIIWNKEDFFCKLKKETPADREIERT